MWSSAFILFQELLNVLGWVIVRFVNGCWHGRLAKAAHCIANWDRGELQRLIEQGRYRRQKITRLSDNAGFKTDYSLANMGMIDAAAAACKWTMCGKTVKYDNMLTEKEDELTLWISVRYSSVSEWAMAYGQAKVEKRKRFYDDKCNQILNDLRTTLLSQVCRCWFRRHTSFTPVLVILYAITSSTCSYKCIVVMIVIVDLFLLSYCCYCLGELKALTIWFGLRTNESR